MEDKKWVWRTPSWVPGHTERYLTDPQSAHMWDSTNAGGPGLIPSLLLITTGRKTGELRYTPLIYQEVEEGYCVIASKGGYPSHPHWYLNLVSDPDCEIRVANDSLKVKARQVEGAERERLWAVMSDFYPPYDDYQARTDRPIPVLLLERLEG